MPWSAGTFTRTYGSTGWQGDAAAGTPIVADRHDTNDQDLATGVNACLNKDGSNFMTANLNMGGFIPTNLGAGTAAAPAVCAGNDQDTGMYSGGANTLNFATNGVERFRIDSSGNSLCLGILRLGATGGEGGELRIRNAANLDNFILDCGPGDVIRYLNSNNTDQYWENNSVERMRLTAAGNVGIGNTSPNSLLEVGNGTGQRIVRINGGLTNTAEGAALYIQNGATTSGAFGHYSAIIGGAANATPTIFSGTDTIFYNAAERMRITSGGNVGIGIAAPTSQLHLSTDFALKQTTTTWQTVSDGRIKKNITPYEKGLADILQVNPVNFEYNGKGGTTDGVQGISVIAQEIQPIFPEAVGVTITKLNEDDEEPTEILNFTTHAITFALINAIKELSAKLDTLTERVEALEV